MVSVESNLQPIQACVPRVPRLESGDHLSREEFERRYAAMPESVKAELIEGVVYMASPVRHTQHSGPHARLGGWAAVYQSTTPGVDIGDNGTLRLDADNEPQPDLLLRIEQACGGQSRVDEDGYLAGAPEFVAEVAASSASYDLHEKLNAYRRNGVCEYLVWRVEDRTIDWFRLEEGRYVPLEADEQGVFRSRVLPGLWLDARSLLLDELQAVHKCLHEGLATAEHAAFVARLAEEQSKRK